MASTDNKQAYSIEMQDLDGSETKEEKEGMVHALLSLFAVLQGIAN